MCGRFFLARRAAEIARALGLAFSPQAESWRPRYNIAPTQDVLAVVAGESGPIIEPRRWGLIPHWAKDAAIGNRMINARLETLAEKPSYARPLKSTRCVVLADGFFEWKKDGARKIPVSMTAQSGEILGFAGLWTTWKPPEGDSVRSCTIITRVAELQAAEVHDRMPAFLPRAMWEEWIGAPEEKIGDVLKRILAKPPDLTLTPLSTLVNSPRNDSPDVLKPA